MTTKNEEICVRMKDGKMLIARKGKPFFPEPVDKDVIIVADKNEAFLTGPYPQFNTMILPLSQYHRLIVELKNNCPNAKSWRITAIVFICMFVIMICLYLQQMFFSRDIFKQIAIAWKKEKIC